MHHLRISGKETILVLHGSADSLFARYIVFQDGYNILKSGGINSIDYVHVAGNAP